MNADHPGCLAFRAVISWNVKKDNLTLAWDRAITALAPPLNTNIKARMGRIILLTPAA